MGATPGSELIARIHEPDSKASEIAALLDGLDPKARVVAIRSLGRREQRRLYERVDGFAPLRLTDMVPERTAALVGVRHFGRNTLPAFTLFEKRFYRAAGVDAAAPASLWGYNFQPTGIVGRVTGPGYFGVVEDPNLAELLVDYRQVPPPDAAARPPGWPAVQSNERGLARFVYGFMVDTLRRVSEHVSIGSAARNGRDLGSWFILCREP